MGTEGTQSGIHHYTGAGARCRRCGQPLNAPVHSVPPAVRAGGHGHATHIAHLPHMGKWQAYCDLCGRIGLSQDFEGDAVAIAERHAEIGGFG